MGQESVKPEAVGLPGQWHKFKRGCLHHCCAKGELLQLEGQSQQIAICSFPIESKTSQQIVDIFKYYQSRARVASHQHLVPLFKLQLLDPKGNDISSQIERNLANADRNSKEKINVNTLCNLSIFEGYCNRNILQEKARLNGELKLTQEYFANNLQFEVERRREKREHYKESQLFQIMLAAVQASMVLFDSQFKEPLLSPLAIKISRNGKVKVGEWELSHFFEDKNEHEEETNFLEEGETYLQPESNPHQKEKDAKEFSQFNVLTHYYWPPEGTTAMQTVMALGVKCNRISSKGQIFSLGMTLLHTLLERPLYQRQTYSEKIINQYIEEAINFRSSIKQPLSNEITALLRKMLAWDPKERIGYYQLEGQLVDIKERRSQISRSIQTQSAQGIRSVRIPIAKSVLIGRELGGSGSGSIDQGFGDEAHPQAQLIQKGPNTLRVKTQDSFDYQKIDYTIRRERKEWQMFQNRLSTSSTYQANIHQQYASQPGFKKQLFQEEAQRERRQQTFNSFPAEIMIEDEEDSPNEEQMCKLPPDNSHQRQVTDQELSSVSNEPNQSEVADSIKLLDISNIKVRRSAEKTGKSKFNPQSTQKFLGHSFENEESFSTLLHGKQINVQAFMNQSDSLLLKSSKSPKLQKQNQNRKPNQELFTSPELMALIRSSAYRPKDNEPSSYRNARLELSPEPAAFKNPKATNSLTFSTYVKEQFAKGWYEGAKAEGLRNGYGTFHYNEGGKYCGDWLNSQMHGQGTLYYADGRIAYQGQWRFDSLNGQGILYNENPKQIEGKFDYRNFNLSEDVWVYYEGTFMNDDKNGRGVLLLSNGERFEGAFQDDLIQGQGTFYSLDGEIIKGEWRQNKLVKIESIEEEDVPPHTLATDTQN